MKIYLDDKRKAPDGYVLCYWPSEVIELLKKTHCEHLSLDHDLGDDNRGTGYDVLLWIEEQQVLWGRVPPDAISVHSSNPSARLKMEAAIRSIDKVR